MKKYILLLLSILVLGSCKETENAVVNISMCPRHLELSIYDLNFDAYSERSATIWVESQNSAWKIVSPASWVKVEPSSGTTSGLVTVSVDEHISADEIRLTYLDFISQTPEYEYSHKISVQQNPGHVKITPASYSLYYNFEAGTQQVGITSNVQWTAVTDADWITLRKDDNSRLTVSVEENLNIHRSGEILLKKEGDDANVYATINIEQSEAGIKSDYEELYFNVNGETKTLKINSDSPWTAYSSDESWLEVTTHGPKGESDLSIKTVKNGSGASRDGFVIIKLGEYEKKKIIVHQEGVKYIVYAKELKYSSVEGRQQFEIAANTSWNVVSGMTEWLEVSPSEAEGNATVVVNVKDNPNTSSRNTTLVLGKEGFDGNAEINISQDGKVFENTNGTVSFDNNEGTQEVEIITDGYWVASTDKPDWISLSPSSQLGGGMLKISVQENKEEGERDGTVSVAVGDKTIKIKVLQEGRMLNVSYEKEIEADTKKITLSIQSNSDWTAEVDNTDWLHMPNTEGKGNINITVLVDENESSNSRKGRIVVRNNLIRNVEITQKGRKAKTNINDGIYFTSNGGKSARVIVHADGPYTLVPSEPWIKVVEKYNTFVVEVDRSAGTREGRVDIKLVGDDSGYVLPIKVVQE